MKLAGAFSQRMGTAGKILIVDDDAYIRRLLNLHMRTLPFEIFDAATGEEALELLQEHHFDVVLLDLILPYYGGFALCQKIKNRGSDAPYLIIMTGEDSPEVRATAEECGADDFVSKPFDPNDVVQRIEILSLPRRKKQPGSSSADIP